jgi:hypothetical protein
MNCNRKGLVARKLGSVYRIQGGLPYVFIPRSREWCSISLGGSVVFRVEKCHMYISPGLIIRESHILREDPL